MSWLAMLPDAERQRGAARLLADLHSGEWDRRHGHLRQEQLFDGGYHIALAQWQVIADRDARGCPQLRRSDGRYRVPSTVTHGFDEVVRAEAEGRPTGRNPALPMARSFARCAEQR